MKEIISNYAGHIGSAAIFVAFVAFTVESVAKDRALWAAIWSPFATIMLIVYAIILAEKLGLLAKTI
ncbi:MAG: hypothetical protein EP336_09620 [Rhodobacteraceae bacterium]|nr:MAG: hypothetical protein EP336_09620 [Paracoccaceae bacterium]